MTKGRFQPWRPHPWHGLQVGPDAPETVNAYIEITPFDWVKYEVDKATGYLKVDRPQRTSAQPPTLYGFIPRTLCAERIRGLSPGTHAGDGDPLDICVLSERPISKSEVVVPARVVGGLQMVDGGEADDKIVAVLLNDYVWGEVRDLGELPRVMIERLQHYFLTYKLVAGESPRVEVKQCYGREHSHRVVEGPMADYEEAFAAEPANEGGS